MEKNTEIVDNFEEILKQHSTNSIPALYSYRTNQIPRKVESITAQDVLKNVSSKIKAINNADCFRSVKQVPKYMNRYKKSTFLPVNMLQRDKEPPQQPINKFETQCVSDTQLIGIIQDAEALIGINKGMTQEFENSFCAGQEIEDEDDEIIPNVTQKEPGFCIVDISLKNLDPNKTINLIQLTNEENVNLIEKQTESTPMLNECIEIEDNIDQNDLLQDIKIPSSPIFNVRSQKKPSLVFTLEAFEKFERIAFPIVQESPDLETAKQLINSLMIGEELYIQTDVQFELKEDDQSSPILSPILSIEKSKIDNKYLKPNCTKEFDRISEGSDKFILKDEILFSSDEENEYIHKSFQELPFTCALETSFYDQSDVLDKTMFVGFQTASNKSIQIDTVSFTKAQSIFDDVDKNLSVKGPTLTELVELCDATDNRIVATDKIMEDDFKSTFRTTAIVIGDSKPTINEIPSIPVENTNDQDAVETVKVIEDVFKSSFNNLLSAPIIENSKYEAISNSDSYFIGFKTADGKSIDMSQEALIKSEAIFKDHGKAKLDSNSIGFKTANKTSIEIPREVNKSDDILSNINAAFQKLSQENKNDKFIKPTVSKRKLESFETASNKKIKLSHIALEKTKKVFQDIDLHDEEFLMDTGQEKEIKIPDTISNYFDKPLSLEQNKDQVFEKSPKTDKDKGQDFIDAPEFQNIDDVILKEFENEEMAQTQFMDDIETDRNFVEFKTASNKRIKISEAALAKTKNVFQDIDKVDNDFENLVVEIASNVTKENNPVLSEVRFKTASVKENETSNQALPKATSVFHDIDSLEIKDIEVINSYQTIQENLRPEKHVLKDLNQPSTSNAFAGFKTANNKVIRISENAMSKTKNIFMDIDNEEYIKPKSKQSAVQKEFTKPINTNDHKFQGFKTASNKNVKISSDNLLKSKKLFQDIEKYFENDRKEKEIESACVVFQTASSKEIKLSKNALDNSRQLFHDLEVTAPENSAFKGFQTASNKVVQISAEAFAKSRKIFQDIEQESMNFEEPKPDLKPAIDKLQFEGFKTASNKAVTISTEALVKSRSIFQDINYDDFKNKEDIASKFQGIQSDCNKKIEVPKKALEKSKKIFQDENIFDTDIEFKNKEENIPCQGFQTASNKKVLVSKAALEKTKKIFLDEDIFTTEKNRGFIGFQTASNKKVHVSKEALEKTKKIFQDEEIFNTHKNQEENILIFQGFQTACNKKVEVTKEALEKTKQIFQDEEIFNTDDKTSGFIGFQTASSKNVQISKEALEKTKKIFKDERIFFEGFQTASNKKVSISEDAIAKSRKIFEDFEEKSNFTDDKVSFKGFQTASNKEVKVSEQALAKSKLLFQDIDCDDTRTEDKTIGSREEHTEANVFAFKTANNNNIKTSEHSLEKSKHLFAGLDKANTEKSSTELKSITTEHYNVDSIINTQVLNNFEVTLNTEDFMKENRSTPNASERSGSPILSCPKPKTRKKFKIPYSQCKVKNMKDIKTIEKEIQNTDILKFDTAYKKNKKYRLKDLEKLEKENENVPKNIDPYIFNFDYENLLSFEFIDERNDVNDSKWTTEDLKNHFLNSVNKKLVPDGWFEKHLRLILWKLISYEIRFPNTMKGICSVQNVIDQLKYRYDKELYNAVRPALRKIFEKDDVSTRTIVLCVVAIYGDGVSVDNTTNTTELLLTDGWYCIRAITDKMLNNLIRDQKIVVGTKIVTNGAELLNCEQGVSPWEDTTAIRLRLSGNSTRRARWDARLGCHGNAAILCRLSSVRPEGGRVSMLRAFVCRVYPALYIDKFDDGSTVTRSERLEHLHQMKYETERQVQLEKLYEEVEKEFSDQSNLSQTVCLPNSNSKREKLLKDIQTRVEQKMEERGLNVTRNVVPLTKVRVADVDGTSRRITKAMLSIWKPNDAILEMIKEGVWIEIMNVVPTAVRYSELHISAGRQSVFSLSKYKEPEKMKPYTKSLKRTCHAINDLAKNPSLSTEYNEIDTVGLTFLIDPSNKEFDSTKHQFQNVYLADADKNIICINFWGGLRKFGFENILDTGQIVSCMNLQKRAGNTRKNIPQYRVTEFSFFTKTPRSEDARKIIEDLSKKLYGVDRKRFCDDCAVLKNNYSAVKLQNNNENVSPYRFQNVDINLSRNKVFIDAPLATTTSKNDEILNLTGLDFESTFKQTETQELSPKTLLRKRQVKEKIAKLKLYGEPPPLSPINITNRSKIAGKAFKSPLISKSDTSTSVASEKKIVPNEQKIVNEELQCSPVLNRTYVKRIVKPVKLNFSNSVAMGENNVSEVVDNFADDFESSPPLSLD